jgi:outer membrane protein, multidrug efflux system
MKRLEYCIASVLVLLALGCKVGPNYKRPVTDTPQNFRGATAPDLPSLSAESVGDEKWSEVFKDSVLQKLISEALANNFDIRIAAQRVLEAQAQAGIVRAQQLPTLTGGGNYSALQLPDSLAASNNTQGGLASSFLFGGGLSASSAWNLDFWGLYRRQTESARAELLATEWGKRATQTTVIEQVAQSYLQLRTLDAQLEITQRTIEARQNSLHLTQKLEERGATSLADVREAEELLYTAKANLPALQREIEQQENELSVLLGRKPGPIERGIATADQPHPEHLPAGIPSQLLERRPDIQQAEAKLISANAQIGVAKAQFFPQFSLTGLGGSSSSALNTVFTAKNGYWYAAGSFSQTIFDGGRLRNNYKFSKAEQQEMLVAYQKTIAGALRDVSNALVAYQKTEERREQQDLQTKAAADAVRLAKLRYDGGNTSYLEVLTTDTDLYTAQLTLADAQQQEALSLVQVYTALGGGWQ